MIFHFQTFSVNIAILRKLYIYLQLENVITFIPFMDYISNMSFRFIKRSAFPSTNS